MPWENTEKHIRSGHRDAEEFHEDTLKNSMLNEEEGIEAVVDKPKGKDNMEVVSYLFDKDKGWTLEKAKDWFEKHHAPAKEHVYAVLPFTITEKIMEKPLRIRGVDGDFRMLSVEYYVDAKTQTLETLVELGREQPLLAD
jgi:hypothetical protein